jgi:predicted transport protein
VRIRRQDLDERKKQIQELFKLAVENAMEFEGAGYTVDQHLTQTDPSMRGFVDDVRNYILNLDHSIQEIPNRYYLAYRTDQNFVCMRITTAKVVLYLKIDPTELDPMPSIARDVSNIGHAGTGDLEVTMKTEQDAELAKGFIKQSFQNVSG